MLQDSHEWTMWLAQEAIGESRAGPVAQREVVALEVLRTRKKHWGQLYQNKFSRWLQGERGCPTDGLGYTRHVLIRHLERQFLRGMSWSNYAGYRPFKSTDVWVVDHIVPKRLFAEEDVQHAYALSNLRPLWIDDNMVKGNTRRHLV